MCIFASDEKRKLLKKMKTVNEFNGYFMMPWDIAVDSTKSEILIYGYLFSMNNGTEWIELSYSQIMEAVGISKRNIVSDALSKFESKGYITIERNNQSRNRIKFNNVYICFRQKRKEL